ncbi:hypothetical protein G6F23_015512 [Rhizopus arrhizus]|nr:hypothetical protein G6F23_015512 [Rhizopus arrhizus]
MNSPAPAPISAASFSQAGSRCNGDWPATYSGSIMRNAPGTSAGRRRACRRRRCPRRARPARGRSLPAVPDRD